MKVASLTTEVKVLKSLEADNEWLVATNNNLRAIVEKLTKGKT
jgi:cell division protein FtsB